MCSQETEPVAMEASFSTSDHSHLQAKTERAALIPPRHYRTYQTACRETLHQKWQQNRSFSGILNQSKEYALFQMFI